MNEDITRKIETLRQKPTGPEQAGPEFYDAGTARPEQPFRPDFAKSEKADQVAEIIKPGMHTEAVIPMPEKSPEKEHPALLTRLINPTEKAQEYMSLGQSGKLSPNALNEGLEALMDEDKAA